MLEVFYVLTFLAVFLLAQSTTRLRVEYLENPLTIDVKTPRFSWALQHSVRSSLQSAYTIEVQTAPAVGPRATIWNTYKVVSNISLNIPYGGPALLSDTDYAWTIIWWDGGDVAASPVTGFFSTALFDASAWRGAQWLAASNTTNISIGDNVFRSTFRYFNPPLGMSLCNVTLFQHAGRACACPFVSVWSRLSPELSKRHSRIQF